MEYGFCCYDFYVVIFVGMWDDIVFDYVVFFFVINDNFEEFFVFGEE